MKVVWTRGPSRREVASKPNLYSYYGTPYMIDTGIWTALLHTLSPPSEPDRRRPLHALQRDLVAYKGTDVVDAIAARSVLN